MPAPLLFLHLDAFIGLIKILVFQEKREVSLKTAKPEFAESRQRQQPECTELQRPLMCCQLSEGGS